MLTHSVGKLIGKIFTQKLSIIFIGLILTGLLVGAHFLTASAGSGTLSVEIFAGYNLVVDSNVKATSTYAPNVATVTGKFCNTSTTNTLTNVYGYVGNHTGSGNGTPGIYPVVDSTGSDFQTGGRYAYLFNSGNYSFTHLGGETGLGDATRYMGDLAPGECKYQYWHFTYPRCENNENPPCSGDALWGDSNDDYDDLRLSFDVWGKDGLGSNWNDATWTMTLRNEISAMANKIKPNPDGMWFNTAADTVAPGETVTTNGIHYALGNINQGFDNDGDGTPDYNVWLQPIGDPSYDPTCFRLISTSGTLTITRSSGNPDYILHFDENLYFTNLPDDNTGGEGVVYYTFMALKGPCFGGLSPYQEVASGSNNEKFNSDYGAGIPPVSTYEVYVDVDKTSSPNIFSRGGTAIYTIPFLNDDSAPGSNAAAAGRPDYDMPLVYSDTVPSGFTYTSDSITWNGDNSRTYTYVRQYSTDGGVTWNTGTPPTGPNTSLIIQWRLNEPLEPGDGGYITLNVGIPVSFPSTTVAVTNRVCAYIGDRTPALDCATKTNLIAGNNSLGDTVWNDNGVGTGGVKNNGMQDGSEAGIAGILVTLYWDQDGDGVLDATDLQVMTTTTNANVTGNYLFSNLPDANFLVVVDTMDSDIPTGYAPTTKTTYAINLDAGGTNPNPVSNLTADFGFGPSLEVVKTLTTSDPAYEGELVTFKIDLRNLLAGDGTSAGNCRYTVWASDYTPDDDIPASPQYPSQGAWYTDTNAINAPDGLFAFTRLASNENKLGLSGFNINNPGGNITKVEVVVYIKETKNLKPNDDFTIQVFHSNAQIGTNFVFDGGGTPPDDFASPIGTWYEIKRDITSFLTNWYFSDFANNTTEMELLGRKGGNDPGHLGVDAAGYIITTDQTTCGGSDTTITYLPLVDTYPTSLLDYVSASIEPSIINRSTGTLTWYNLGPLYAGGTKIINVTFRAKAVTSPQTATNTASVTTPEFGSGRLANDGSDNATVEIRPAGSIKGYVYANNETSGGAWYPNLTNGTGYSPLDSRISNVKLELYGCVKSSTGLLLKPTEATSTKSCTDASNGGSWVLLATAITDGSGYYIFDGLRDGFYNVHVDNTTIPAGYACVAEAAPTGNGAGTTTCDGWWNSASADLNTFNSVDNTIPPNYSDDIQHVSFGYASATGAVTGYVWFDTNGNGIWDSGEQPISGVTVYLCAGTSNCTGSAIWTTTDVNGHYMFAGLAIGTNYRVGVSQPGGTTQTGDPDYPNQTCSGPNCDNQNAVFTVVASQVAGPYNFGYDGTLNIGDTIYADWNGDGNQDVSEGEEGIQDVVVYLYRDADGDGVLDATDPLIASDTTDTNGNYSFDGLPGGGSKYIVRIVTSSLPAGFIQTGDPDATLDSLHAVTLTTSSYLTADFGYQPRGYGSIGDQVWRDTDGSGTMQIWETGIANVSLVLYQDQDGDGVLDPQDAPVYTTTTNASGVYGFFNLYPGNYIVKVNPSEFNSGQELYRLTMSTVTEPPYNVSQVSYQVSLGDAEIFTDADFGFTNSAIGNLVWQDNNGDGLVDASEPGISGVYIDLYQDLNNDGDYNDPGETSPVVSTQTSATGEYYFTGLPAGDYIVVLRASNFSTGGPLDTAAFSPTYDPDAYDIPCVGTGASGCDRQGMLVDPTAGYGLPLGSMDYSRDFGYQPLARLGETVWINTDGDSVRDSDEAGIANITISLYRCVNGCGGIDDILVMTTATDSSGYYSFGNLTNGTYVVVVDTADVDFPANLSNNYDPDGGPYPADSQTQVVVSGGVVTTVGSCTTDCSMAANFGYTLSGSYSISGTVFLDGNQSGNTYEGEPNDSPYGNIPLYLYACGTGTCFDGDEYLADIITTTITGPYTGTYAFTGLPAGTYRVAVDKNAPSVALATQTAEPNNVNNCNPNCQNYEIYVLSGDVTNQDYGFYLGAMDCGDLPDKNYKTLIASEGACHVVGTTPLYLGSQPPDTETDGQPSLDATGENANGFDEADDYRDLTTKWQNGFYATLNIPVTGSGGYLVAWFDWDGNGYFSGDYETVVFGAVNAGMNTFNVYVPTTLQSGYTTGDPLFVRYRLYASEPSVISPTGTVLKGEVEDYEYKFGPTAVGLSSFGAASPDRNLFGFGALALLAVLLAGLAVWRLRLKQA